MAPELEPAPSKPIVDGEPVFGTYRGVLETTSLESHERGVGRLRMLLSEKHWQWFAAADDSIAVGGAVVDAGLAGTVFCWVADRQTGELLDVSRLRPSFAFTLSKTPTSGLVAQYRFGGERLAVTRDGASLSIRGELGEIAFDLEFEAPLEAAVTAVCPVPEGPPGAVNVTQKELAVAVSGAIVANGNRHDLEGVGLLDHSHGLLARETYWRWAMGVGRGDEPVGFTLVSGFNDGLENVVWIDGEPRAVGPARVEPPAGRGPWRATAEEVDVSLEAEAERRAGRDLGVVASQYRQPLGTWSGGIGGRDLEDVFGVAEVHRARW